MITSKRAGPSAPKGRTDTRTPTQASGGEKSREPGQNRRKKGVGQMPDEKKRGGGKKKKRRYLYGNGKKTGPESLTEGETKGEKRPGR